MCYVLDVPTNKIYFKHSTNCYELIFLKCLLFYIRFGTRKENIIEIIDMLYNFSWILQAHCLFCWIYTRCATEVGMLKKTNKKQHIHFLGNQWISTINFSPWRINCSKTCFQYAESLHSQMISIKIFKTQIQSNPAH